MILVDTSIWVDFLRSGDERLAFLLEEGEVVVHPFVIGELALGGLRKRQAFLRDLMVLPQAMLAEDCEVLALIEKQSLHGTGIGYVDAHLLASARISDGLQLWTRDHPLAAAAARLGLSASIVH